MGPWVHVARVVRWRPIAFALVAMLAVAAGIFAARTPCSRSRPRVRTHTLRCHMDPAPPPVVAPAPPGSGCVAALEEYELARRSADEARLARANTAVESCLDRSVPGRPR